MASLARLGGTALRLNKHLIRPSMIRVAAISTSKKNKDTATIADSILEPRAKTKETAVTNKNWVSWGFDIDSQTEDNTAMHMTFFFSVTLCLVTTGFIWAYMPDFRMVDWAQREAYLQLRQREADGRPLIDPNLIDLEKIELPEDEELGAFEIII